MQAADRLAVTAVVLTYNRRALLERALACLSRQSYRLATIIVIDNASTDGTREFLRGMADPRVQVVGLERNIGPAAGFALGMEHACRGGHDLIWVMDDDVLPQVDALEVLLDAYRKLVDDGCRPNLMVSSAVSEVGEPMNVPSLDIRSGPNGYSSWPKRLRDGVMPISQATFVGALFPRRVIEEHGLPIGEMFQWGDDIEYTYRVTRSGPGFVVGGSIVVHLGRCVALSIHDDLPADRLQLFFYYYRNNLSIARRRGAKAFLVAARFMVRDLIRLVRNRQWRRLLIMLRGIAASVAFNPKPTYLSREKDAGAVPSTTVLPPASAPSGLPRSSATG